MTETHDPADTDPSPLFTAQAAAGIVPRRAFAPVHAYFAQHGPALAAALSEKLPGYTRVTLQENPDNYGLYLRDAQAPAPFFWFGLGWRPDDPPEVLPGWGASLEVNFQWVAPFEDGAGGLRDACERAANATPGRLGLHRFAAHVELAEWRDFEWLLASPDQRAALQDFWATYLALLHDAGVLTAVDAYLRELR